MTFQFSYQKVLDFKEKQKELAELEFGQVKSRALEIQEQLQGLEQVKEQAFNQYNEIHRKSVWEMMEFQQGIDYLNCQMKRLEYQSKQVHQEVEQKQQMLIEKTKEAKMWNQWKSNSMQIFQKQLEQKEQSMFDEMAVIRYSRKA